jgi:hypothetical protein
MQLIDLHVSYILEVVVNVFSVNIRNLMRAPKSAGVKKKMPARVQGIFHDLSS